MTRSILPSSYRIHYRSICLCARSLRSRHQHSLSRSAREHAKRGEIEDRSFVRIFWDQMEYAKLIDLPDLIERFANRSIRRDDASFSSLRELERGRFALILHFLALISPPYPPFSSDFPDLSLFPSTHSSPPYPPSNLPRIPDIFSVFLSAQSLMARTPSS